MKMKTRLSLNTWISLGAILLMMVSIAWTSWEVYHTAQNEQLVAQIRKAAFDRIALRDDYLLHPEERAKVQWYARSDNLKGLLESAVQQLSGKEEKEHLQDVRRGFHETLYLFSMLVEKQKQGGITGKINTVISERESRLTGQLFLRAYALMDSIERLQESTHKTATKARNTEVILILFFVTCGGMAIVVNSIITNRNMIKGLSVLHEGVKIIGSGNLNYRIEVAGDDELADLARENNGMAAKLKESYVSVEKLQQEVVQRKQAQEEREGLITELQKALSEVKALSGLLPICASCKKIRDDKGYWNQIEGYISKHSEAVFSHGICPDCVKKLYPELGKKNRVDDKH